MANPEHVDRIKAGVASWNQWRKKHPEVQPDLTGADLFRMNLAGINLRGANLGGHQRGAILRETNLSKADLREANLYEVNFIGAKLDGADMRKAVIAWSDCTNASFAGANLEFANIEGANLSGVNLEGAVLNGAWLQRATLVGTNLVKAEIHGCKIWGISAWDLNLEGANQSGHIISFYKNPWYPKTDPNHLREGEVIDSVITVDDMEVAQFIYFMLNNKRIRRVIDTMTAKAVLILGRFKKERKEVLDAIRTKLSSMDYLPIIFDFDKPADRDLTETVVTLAGLSKFVMMDLSDPSSSPHEAMATIAEFKIPFLPIIEKGQRPYAMFGDLRKKYTWVLQVVSYNDKDHLVSNISKLTKLAEKKYHQIQIEKNQQREEAIDLDDI